MPRLALLLALALGACAPPARIVIHDDPELAARVVEAVARLEAYMGCTLYEKVEVGGKARDWRGIFPPWGTVTIKVNRRWLRRGDAGRAYYAAGGRARIVVISNKPSSALVAHELVHVMGFKGHKSGTGLMSKAGGSNRVEDALDKSSEKTLDLIQSRCLD